MTDQARREVGEWKEMIVSKWIKSTGAVGILAIVLFVAIYLQYLDYKTVTRENSTVLVEVVRQNTAALTRAAIASENAAAAAQASIEASKDVIREIRKN